MYPDLATATVSGFERGDELEIYEDGQAVQRRTRASEGLINAFVNDFWFCTNPEILALHAFPDESQWQLLSVPKLLTAEDFENVAYLQPGFFLAQLLLLTENGCSVTSRKGMCSVTLGIPPGIIGELKFKYKLFFDEKTGDFSSTDPSKLPKMVMYAPGTEEVTFTMRLPVIGEYIFKTWVLVDEAYTQCFEMRMICTEPFTGPCTLPVDPGETGLGYNPSARDYGLRYPSKTTPTVKVKPEDVGKGKERKEQKLTFKIDDDRIDELEFSSDFVDASGDDSGMFDFPLLCIPVTNGWWACRLKSFRLSVCLSAKFNIACKIFLSIVYSVETLSDDINFDHLMTSTL